jgi:hypothetical protein
MPKEWTINLTDWRKFFIATAKVGCRLLLSEDLQEGFPWRGVTVTNPFAQTRSSQKSRFQGGFRPQGRALIMTVDDYQPEDRRRARST